MNCLFTGGIADGKYMEVDPIPFIRIPVPPTDSFVNVFEPVQAIECDLYKRVTWLEDGVFSKYTYELVER